MRSGSRRRLGRNARPKGGANLLAPRAGDDFAYSQASLSRRLGEALPTEADRSSPILHPMHSFLLGDGLLLVPMRLPNLKGCPGFSRPQAPSSRPAATRGQVVERRLLGQAPSKNGTALASLPPFVCLVLGSISAYVPVCCCQTHSDRGGPLVIGPRLALVRSRGRCLSGGEARIVPVDRAPAIGSNRMTLQAWFALRLPFRHPRFLGCGALRRGPGGCASATRFGTCGSTTWTPA